MMKKLLMMAFAVLGLATNAVADDLSVSVISVDGDTATIGTLPTIEKMEFANDSVYVTLTDGETEDWIEFAIKDADKILFSAGSASGIKSLNAAGGSDKVTIAANGSALNVNGVAAGTLVTVFDMNGRLAMKAKATGESVTLDATGLKSGVYIVRAGNKAIKIIKK